MRLFEVYWDEKGKILVLREEHNGVTEEISRKDAFEFFSEWADLSDISVGLGYSLADDPKDLLGMFP